MKQVEKDLSELHINQNDKADRSNYPTTFKTKSFVTSLTEVTDQKSRPGNGLRKVRLNLAGK